MKIRAAAIILLLIILVMSACQPTPNMQPVVGRQKDILESVTAAAFEKIQTPEHVSETYKDFAKLNIIFDADVIVPETTAYPVTEVTKRTFSDEDILAYMKLLTGKNDEIYREWNLTKEEWKEKITKAKPYVESGKLLQGWLESMQEKYDKAETEVSNTLVNISELPMGRESRAYIKNADNTVSEFFLKRGENYFAYCRDINLDVYPASFYEDSDFDENSDTVENFTWYKPGEPEMPQEDAYNEALEYINKMGVGLELYSAEPCTVLVDEVEKTTGWLFIFTRAISNMQAQYKDIGYMVSPFSTPSYGAPWMQEICRIVIDINGLCTLRWQGVSETNGVGIESVRLESFETIEQRIANQLNYMYGASGNSSEDSLDVKVTGIELGISLISEKDKTDAGLYIPTWYVSYIVKGSDQEDTKANWDKNQIMFNAIDGSYIEPRTTNKDLMEMAEQMAEMMPKS